MPAHLDSMCTGCQATDAAFSFEPVSARGTVRSWTGIQDAFLTRFRVEVPYILVDVELDGQLELRISAPAARPPQGGPRRQRPRRGGVSQTSPPAFPSPPSAWSSGDPIADVVTAGWMAEQLGLRPGFASGLQG